MTTTLPEEEVHGQTGVVRTARKDLDQKINELRDMLTNKRIAATMDDVCNIRGQIAAFEAVRDGVVAGRVRPAPAQEAALGVQQYGGV